MDKYSSYIAHYSLLTFKDIDSVSLEGQNAIGNLRKDSLAEPVIQSDNGLLFIVMEFRIILMEKHLTQKLIKPHMPEQNAIIERVNKTMRESPVSIILIDYEQVRSKISRIIQHYN